MRKFSKIRKKKKKGKVSQGFSRDYKLFCSVYIEGDTFFSTCSQADLVHENDFPMDGVFPNTSLYY